MKVADLFCGCGGFSLGFDYLEDFELVYALDNWDVACKSYGSNFPSVDIDCRDALDVKPQEIPRVDVLIGGPPCQAFSIVNNKSRRSFDSSLVGWFCSIVEYANPKFWIMENVPPLFDFIPAKYHKKIYRLSDYGVPQIRRRVFAGKYNEPKKHPTNTVFPTILATEYKGMSHRNGERLASLLKRKSLIPEAKLVQTFPLDFILCGTLQDQYIQVGNAVPPLMAYRLAEALVNPSQKKLCGVSRGKEG